MTTAREIALEVLPHFARAVLAGHIYSYGHYATAIGRDASTESLVIGKAMHAIGGACVMCAVPVAPLHFVERADGEWRGVFETNAAEITHVLPHYDLLCITAREHRYSEADFQRISKALREVLPKYLGPNQLSPHDIWFKAITLKLKDGSTPFTRALEKYKVEFDEMRRLREDKKFKN